VRGAAARCQAGVPPATAPPSNASQLVLEGAVEEVGDDDTEPEEEEEGEGEDEEEEEEMVAAAQGANAWRSVSALQVASSARVASASESHVSKFTGDSERPASESGKRWHSTMP